MGFKPSPTVNDKFSELVSLFSLFSGHINE